MTPTEPKSDSDQAHNFGSRGTHGRSCLLGQQTCTDQKDMSLCELSSHDQTLMSAGGFPTHRLNTQYRCYMAGHPHWPTKSCQCRSRSNDPPQHHRASLNPRLQRTGFFLYMQETPPRSAICLHNTGCMPVLQAPMRPRSYEIYPDHTGHRADYQSTVEICQVGTQHMQAILLTTMPRFRYGTCLPHIVCTLLRQREVGSARLGSCCKQPAP